MTNSCLVWGKILSWGMFDSASAHLTSEGVANEFNCHTWVKTDAGAHWTDETGSIVLTEIQKLDCVDGFRPTVRLAVDTAKQLSADSQTLLVSFDVEYAGALSTIAIDPHGRYYGIATGAIRDIDPTTQYYQGRTSGMSCTAARRATTRPEREALPTL